MDKEKLRTLQTPLKEKYKSAPQTAIVTLRAESNTSDGIACKIGTARALREAGLHPAAGGDGTQLCSGDLLLEALVACAGVTLKAVATALDIPNIAAEIQAEGDLDFRGTLGISKEVQVGFREIRLYYKFKSQIPSELLEKLIELTERYCVVLQTLKANTQIQSRCLFE